MKIKTFVEPGTCLYVHKFLKKRGAKYLTHLMCSIIVDGKISEECFAVPLHYLFLEPKSASIKEELIKKYQERGLNYENYNLDRTRLDWLRDKIYCFLHITVIENIAGASNFDPNIQRQWPVWKWEVEDTYEEDNDWNNYDDYDRQRDLDEMYRGAYEGDPEASWNND